MKRIIVSLLFAVGLVGPAFAQVIDDATQARLDLVARTGRELNDHDQSAWHVSDALAETVPPDFVERELKGSARIGYITERVDEDHVKTIFIKTVGETAEILFTGIVSDGEVGKTEDYTDTQRPPATPEQVQRLAMTAKLREEFSQNPCGEAPNVIAFPALDQPGATDFYVLTPETETGIVQFGGHRRVRIGADGAREEKVYANSCFSQDTRGADGGNVVVMLAITVPINISDIPTEIHVFKSLSHGLPIIVGSVRGVWDVDGDNITLNEARDPEAH